MIISLDILVVTTGMSLVSLLERMIVSLLLSLLDINRYWYSYITLIIIVLLSLRMLILVSMLHLIIWRRGTLIVLSHIICMFKLTAIVSSPTLLVNCRCDLLMIDLLTISPEILVFFITSILVIVVSSSVVILLIKSIISWTSSSVTNLEKLCEFTLYCCLCGATLCRYHCSVHARSRNTPSKKFSGHDWVVLCYRNVIFPYDDINCLNSYF